MKKSEVLLNVENLANLDTSGLSGVKMSYAIIKNVKTLEEESKSINESLKYPQDFLDMQEDLREIFKDHALKDDKGEFIIKEDQYQLDPIKIDDYQEAVKEKRDNSKAIIEEAKVIESEFNKFLEEDSCLSDSIVKIKLDDLPKDVTPSQMAVLSFMIEELL